MSSHRRRHQRLAIDRRQTKSSSAEGAGSTATDKDKSEAPPTKASTQQTTTTTTNNTPTQQSSTTPESKPTTSSTPQQQQPPPTTQTTPTTSPTTQTTTSTTSTSTSSTIQSIQTTQQQSTSPTQNQSPDTAQRGTNTVFATTSGRSLSSISSASPTSTLGSDGSSNGGGSGAGKVIGIVAGVVGGIVAICVIAGWIMRIWRKKQDREEAEALGNSFSASEFRKSAVLLHESSSRSPRPPSIIERRLNSAPISVISTSGGYPPQHGGGYGFSGYPQQGEYDQSSYYDYQQHQQLQPQQYQLPSQPYSPTDPFMTPTHSHSGSPVLTYSPAPFTPAPQSAPVTTSLSQPMLSPSGSLQDQEAFAINRLSTISSSSVLVNPHDSVAFGGVAVDAMRHASMSLPGTPTTVEPARGLEEYLKEEGVKRDSRYAYGGL